MLDARYAPEWQAWRYRVAAFWWKPQRGAGLTLRRTNLRDADFYRCSFSDKAFTDQYNRQRPWKGELEKALEQAGKSSPVDLGALHWVVTDSAEKRLGMVTLTSISLENRKAEFSVGFPQASASSRATGAGLMATLLAFNFAFFTAGLNKLTAFVYSDNRDALHNALRVGFEVEGLLKDHFYHPPGGFVDVYALGLTRRNLLENELVGRIARRRLGLNWSGAAQQG